MSDISDGIGGIVEGSAYGRAAEREHGGGVTGAKGHFHETACLNCGTRLVGDYCHGCGQEAHLHRTMGAFLHDLMHGVLHLDGKIWRTLPMLLFRPGSLTRDYIDGHRRRYVSPMALFLFSVFAMFAVFSLVGLSVPTEVPTPTIEGNINPAIEQTDTRIEADRARLATLEEGSPEYAETRKELDDLETARDFMGGFDGVIEDGAFKGTTGIPSLDKGIEKWRENPSLMIYKLQSSGYKFSWLLIPLSLPFMWLMFFWKPQIGLYDHSVFVTYSIGFMSLLFIAASLSHAAGVPGGVIALACTIIPIVHIYKQLRYGYRISRVGALMRTVLLTMFVSIVLTLFLSLLFVLGILG